MISDYIYKIYTDRINSWTLINPRKLFKNNPIEEKRVAYYLWQFPKLSETFIQREILALLNSGMNINIFADQMTEDDLLDDNTKILSEKTTYLQYSEQVKFGDYKKYFFLRNPIAFFNVFLFILATKYNQFKNYKTDLEIFNKSLYLAWKLNENKINHIHSPWANFNAYLSLLAAKLLDIEYSVQARAYDIHRNNVPHPKEQILENSSFIITNSKYNFNHIKTIIGKDKYKRIKIIYNGLNIRKFSKSGKYSNRDPIFKILTVSRITEQKGIIYLLKACKLLKAKKINFKCEIVGPFTDDEYSKNVKKLHNHLKLKKHVFFLGALSNDKVRQKYRQSDAVVLPCIIVNKTGNKDITPNTLLEAMAMKLPVISTNITAIPEIIDNGINGILVPPEDEIELANAIIELSSNKELRTFLGKNARKKIIKQFDISKNIKKYIELFCTGNIH